MKKGSVMTTIGVRVDAIFAVGERVGCDQYGRGLD